VTNAGGSVISSSAALTVVQPVATRLINVNFGAHLSPGLNTNKTGLAAVGKTAQDLWNFYSRDISAGVWKHDGSFENLQDSGGAATGVGLVIANAPGCWANGSFDAMYNTYVYPFDSGNVRVTLTNLPPGLHDLYVYSYDGVLQVSVGAADHGTVITGESSVANPPVWRERQQYAAFRNLFVGPGQSIAITVRPGVFGYSVISGLQLVTVDQTPLAHSQSLNLSEDESAPVMLGGSDPDGDSLTVAVISGPTNGTLSGTAPNLVYTPNTNYHGPDGFWFKVNDGRLDSAPAKVSLSVAPVNDAPVAQSQAVTLDEDTVGGITLGASDADGDALTYSVGAPSHGTLAGTPPDLTYHPDTNYFGPDGFAFTVSDGQSNSQATVSITVRPVNDPPVADASATLPLVISPNNSNAPIVLDGSRSSDLEGDALQYFWFDTGATNASATGIVAVIVRPVGTNALTLVVDDGLATGAQNFAVEIITTAQVVERLTAVANDQVDRPQALIASLNAAIASIDRSNPTAAINQLQAFQNQVLAQVSPLDPVLADQFIQAAQEVIDLLNGGPVNGRQGISRVVCQPNGKVRLQFTAPRGPVYIVEASTNLADWEMIGVATACGVEEFEFEDATASRLAARFYRVVVP